MKILCHAVGDVREGLGAMKTGKKPGPHKLKGELYWILAEWLACGKINTGI